ncbi:MAG: hypothetical protein ABI741_14485 [Ferruginibacter sp.]
MITSLFKVLMNDYLYLAKTISSTVSPVRSAIDKELLLLKRVLVVADWSWAILLFTKGRHY